MLSASSSDSSASTPRKVNTILYVSSVKKSKKGFLIDSGLTSISLFVDSPNTFDQKLARQWIDIPPHVDVLFTKTINKSCWRTEPDFTQESKEERYKENNVYEIAIIHEKFRDDIKSPYFLNSDLMTTQTTKMEMNEKAELLGAYGMFHMGGPVVFSSDRQTLFSMNDEELDFFQSIIHYVLYFFEDSHGKKMYRELLEKQENNKE